MPTYTITNGIERSLVAEIEANEFHIDKDSGHILFKSEPRSRPLRPGEGGSYASPQLLAILCPAPGLLIQIKQDS